MQESKFHLQRILLRGTIANLQRSRRTHDFVLTQFQRNAVGVTAVGAAAMGLGAAGIGLVNMASNADEEADWVEFELDGMQMQVLFWLLPMRNGDVIEIVAEKVGESRYIVYSVKRDGDDRFRLSACCRGPQATLSRHGKNHVLGFRARQRNRRVCDAQAGRLRRKISFVCCVHGHRDGGNSCRLCNYFLPCHPKDDGLCSACRSYFQNVWLAGRGKHQPSQDFTRAPRNQYPCELRPLLLP